jgi:hypothetical protein
LMSRLSFMCLPGAAAPCLLHHWCCFFTLLSAPSELMPAVRMLSVLVHLIAEWLAYSCLLRSKLLVDLDRV